MKILGYTDFFVFSPSRKLIASSQEATIGTVLTGYRGELVDKALKAGALVSRPFRSPFLYPDEKGELRADRPTIVAEAAVPDSQGHPQAVLSFRIPPEGEFTADPADGPIGADGRDVRLRQEGHAVEPEPV